MSPFISRLRLKRIVLSIVGLLCACLPLSAQQPQKIKVLIGLKQNLNQPVQAQAAAVQASINKLGGNVTHSYRFIPAMAAELPAQAVANLLRNPAVNVVELDGEFQAFAEEIPWGVNKINALKNPTTGATEYTGGERVVVAVLDSGIDLDHPDLAANIYVNSAEADGEAGVDDDNNGYVDDINGWNFVRDNNNPDDDNGHGSHCAGSIGAVGENGIGVVGVGPRVTLMPLKVLNRRGSGSFSDMIAALEYCIDNGVHITSNSYGSSGDPGSVVRNAFDLAESKGILNVAAAGNTGNSSGSGENVGYPANYASVMAVASTDIGDNRSSFSSTGEAVEVAAPGSSILSTYKNGGYATLSGTSMACPHVAGAAAVLMSDNFESDINESEKRLRAAFVRGQLIITAVDLGVVGPDSQYGAGRIDVLAARGGTSDDGGGTDPPTGIAHIQSISYDSASRGRDLVITVTIVDKANGDVPIDGASVTILLVETVSDTNYGTAQSTTNESGVVNFRLRRAPSGIYTTTVLDVSKTSFEWDGEATVYTSGF